MATRTLILLFIVSCWAFQELSSPEFKKLAPVTSFQLSHQGKRLLHRGDNLNEFGHFQPYPDSIHVNFTAFGREFYYELHVQKDIFAPEATITVHASSETAISNVPPRVTSYAAKLTKGWVVATITTDEMLHATVVTESEIYEVNPVQFYRGDGELSQFSLLERRAIHGMVALKHSDVNFTNYKCGVQRRADGKNFHLESASSRHLLQLPTLFTDCYPGVDTTTTRLYIGVASDLGFARAVTGTSLDPTAVLAYIGQLVTTANQVYTPQLNLVLTIGKSIIMTTSSTTYPWNYDRVTTACPAINTVLTNFASWRASIQGQTGMDQGLWHLLTDCYPPPGTVGLAYVGEVCSGQWNAGVSSFSTMTWLTSAHEMGHGIGALHAFELGQGVTGGIMDYGDGKYQGIYQFHPVYNRPEVCYQLTQIFQSPWNCSGCIAQSKCYSTFTGPICGNGVVEPGEQCDGNTAANTCCNTVTCQFNPGVECSSGECCNNCKMLPTTSSCSNGAGYCSNGTCQQSICAHYGMTPCTISTSSSCSQTCLVSGACNNLAGYTDGQTGLPIPMNVQAGSICARSATSVSRCSASAKCVAQASTGFSGTWATSSWGTCSATCGSGTQSRTFWCQDVNSNVIANANCDPTATPNSTQSCPNLPACVTYGWVSNWASSLCSNTCGGGTQTQTPTCQNTATGATVANTYCSAATQPATSRSCNTGPCPLSWSTSQWGTCSQSCGSGVQSRSVVCQQTQNSVASTVSSSSCPAPTPASQQSCNTQACTTYSWTVGLWGPCSASCGTGSQSATVTCRDSNSNIVANSFCSGSAPASTQACNTQSCGTASWNTSNWTPCSASCGSGQQQRTVVCMLGGSTVSNAFCSGSTQPPTTQNCNTFNCPIYSWTPSPWTSCSTSCGGGTTTRSVTCQNIAVSPTAPVDPSMCSSTPAPAASITCNAQTCVSYNWSTTDWLSCSATCGGGTQIRTVTCIRVGSTSVVDNSQCTTPQPAAIQNCNTQACTANYIWSSKAWSACSRQCGTGTRARTVTCQNQLSGQMVANSNCVAATKPAATGDCNTQTCPGFWHQGQWGACNRKCGGGTKTRIVECYYSGTTTPAPGLCSGTKPATSTSCNAFACPHFAAADWSGCSSACGSGVQTRAVACLNYDGTPADSTDCASSMPATTQSCDAGACPSYEADTWSTCSSLCGGGNQTLSLTCRDANGFESSSCSVLPNIAQPCGLDACSDYYFDVINLGPCNASCGGGIQTGTLVCIDPTTMDQVNISLCAGTPPSTTVSCNLALCPTYQWQAMSDWTPCTAACGGGWQSRTVSCVDTTRPAVVADALCEALSMPAILQNCNTALDDNCGTFNRGTCKNYTDGYGWCKCRPGYYGDNCTFSPQISNVQMDIALYTEGIPLGEEIQIQWDTTGAMPYLAILLDKGDWKYPMYLATQIINNQSLITQTPTYLWKINQNLPLGDDYQILVFFSPSVFGVSATFALANPCDYVNCGMYGSCVDMKGYCECVEGWSGTNCQLSPCAASQCNSLTATCNNSGLGAGTCVCADGWTGDRCYVPDSCSFTCSNGGLVTGGLSASPSQACAALTCSCYNFFTGPKCESCNVKCQNGGVPDQDCLICQCGANSGWMGHDCSCQYYILGVHVKTQYTDLDWLTSSLDVGTFKQTFAQDMAVALSISPSRILVQDIIDDGITYTDNYKGVQVLFYLTEDCVSISLAQTNVYKAPKVTTHYYESNPQLHSLLAASSPSPQANGTNADLNELVALIISMYGDIDTILYRGYITGNINSAQTLSVLDPFGLPKPTTGIVSETPWISTNYWVVIVIVVLLVFLVGVGVWKYNKSSGYGRPDLDLEPRTLKSGTNVREVFKTGDLLDVSGHGGQSPASTDRESPNPNDPAMVSLVRETRLPEGWTRVFDEKNNSYYYYNTKTGESRWDIPHHPA